MESRTNKSLEEITEELVQHYSPFNEMKSSSIPEIESSEKKLQKQKKRERLLERLSNIKEDENAVKRYKHFTQIFGTPEAGDNEKQSGKKMGSVVLGNDEPFPFDLKDMTLDDLRNSGAEIMTDLNIKFKKDGTVEYLDNDEEKQAKLNDIKEILKEFKDEDLSDVDEKK